MPELFEKTKGYIFYFVVGAAAKRWTLVLCLLCGVEIWGFAALELV